MPRRSLVRTYALFLLLASAGTLVAAQTASGAVIYTTQIRSVTAETGANMQVLTRSATNFERFAETAELSTTITGPGGNAIPNRALAGIDCQLDPNAIRAIGTLSAAGGLDIVGTPTFGEAAAQLEIGFTLTEATQISILATARPSMDPRDRYVLKLSDTNADLLDIDETMPAQEVNFTRLLPAGDYVFEFQVEYSLAGTELATAFSVQALIPTPGALALFGVGGVSVLRRRRR